MNYSKYRILFLVGFICLPVSLMAVKIDPERIMTRAMRLKESSQSSDTNEQESKNLAAIALIQLEYGAPAEYFYANGCMFLSPCIYSDQLKPLVWRINDRIAKKMKRIKHK